MLVKIMGIKCEQRALESDYMEVVANNTQLPFVTEALKAYFGEPVKPAGKDATPEVAKCAKPYGGIYANQTMYFRKEGATVEAALLWPWGSGASTTIKIIRKR